MKNLKTYEELNEKWKIGDIIIPDTFFYIADSFWAKPGKKYKITNIENLMITFIDKENKKTFIMSKAYVDHNFLSEEEYNYQKTVKDYNL